MQIEKWKEDEENFKTHFKIPYLDYCNLIQALSTDQLEKYEKIRGAHEEAAILWAIHEGKSHGLIKETP